MKRRALIQRIRTEAAEDDACTVGLKAGEVADMQAIKVVDVNVVQFTAAIALRMVMFGHVGIEACRAASGLQHLQFAHRGEIVERLIHGAQRDARHQLARSRVQRLDGGMGLVVMQQREQQLPLRCDLQPASPEFPSEFCWCEHVDDANCTDS